MIAVKYLLLFVGVLSVTADDDAVKIPILGSIFGAVENAVHTASDVVIEGEQAIVKATTRDGIKDIIQKALLRFKALMVDKIELLGLPILEPLDINHIDIAIKHEIGVFNGTMDNVKILHLSNFDTRDVTVAASGILAFDIDLNLFFENLEIFGDYDIDANVGDLFHIFGKGPFHLTLHDVNTFITLKKLKFAGQMQFSDIGIKIELGSLSCHFSNLMGGGEPEKLFNKVIEDIAPEAVDNLWPEIEPIISAKMKEIIRFSLIPNKIRRFVDRFQINLSPVTSLFGFNARFYVN